MAQPKTVVSQKPALRYSLYTVLIRTLFSSLAALTITGLLGLYFGVSTFKAFGLGLLLTMFIFAPLSVLFFATRAQPQKIRR